MDHLDGFDVACARRYLGDEYADAMQEELEVRRAKEVNRTMLAIVFALAVVVYLTMLVFGR